MVVFLKLFIVFLIVLFVAFFIECIFGEEIWGKLNPFNNKINYNMYQNQTIPVSRAYGGIFSDMKPIKDFPTISFNQFLDFYYLNPSSWGLKECRVCKNNDNHLSFTFTYEDWKKYKKWRVQLKKDTENKRINEYKSNTTRKILEAVQVDIENIRAESQKDLEKAQELMKEVKLK